MKLISTLKWEASKVCIALVYASTSSDLATTLGDITLSAGSLAYLANGDVYVLGSSWTKIGG